MIVFVIGLTGKRLCPTSPAKARKLLESGRAGVYCRVPFTIQLKYKTGGATGPHSFGTDTGEQHLGFSVRKRGKIRYKAEVELIRSMDKRKRLEKRKAYRRSRRHRKTRYRHPKFRFRTKRVYVEKGYLKNKGGHKEERHWKKLPNLIDTGRGKGWLPPSIQSKVDHCTNWIRRYLDVLPEGTETWIEVARFDIARMIDPGVHGKLYQEGRMYAWENTKAYVLAKFNYTCPVCGKKFNSMRKPRMHHVTMKKNGATDNPDEFAPVCSLCHTRENHLPDAILGKLAKACRRKEYREPVFMNILRKRLFREFPDASFTYGNITNADRKRFGLPKSHANDAAAIASHSEDMIEDCPDVIYFRQVRKKKRSLHEANPRKGRNAPNKAAMRSRKNVPSTGGFYLYDKVEDSAGNVGYISGFTGKSAYLVSFNGKYLKREGKSYKQHNLSSLKFIRHSGNWIWKTKTSAAGFHD